TLNSLSLRTSDGRLGTALLQLRIACDNPIRLVRCREAQDPTLQMMEAVHEGRTRDPQQEAKKSVMQRAWEWFYGSERQISTTYQTKQITMADLYPMIRYELAEAVGNAIHDVDVAALYDRDDT